MIEVFLPDADSPSSWGRPSVGLFGPATCVGGETILGRARRRWRKEFARGLDVPEDHYVNSPTFAILQIHPKRLAFNHMDLYRLADIDEAYGIGLDEVVASDGASYIEWPKQSELIPCEHIRIELDAPGEWAASYRGTWARYRDFLDSCAKFERRP